MTWLLPYTVLLGQVLVFVLIFLFMTRKARLIEAYALWLAFFIALVSSIGSLFLSEMAELTPCLLCWYQRIMMYPLAIILGLAAWKKDKGIVPYGLLLSFIGALVSLYHYIIQITASPLAPCAIGPDAVSCTDRQIFYFGYMTIPVMAFTGFLLIILLLFIARKQHE